MASASIKYNNLCDKICIINAKAQDKQTLLQQDIKGYLQTGSVTLVVANPPYSKVGSGDSCELDSIAMSRFEYTMTLKDTIDTAQHLLSTGGRFCIVHKTSRMAEVITQCSNQRLEPKRIQLIGKKLFLLECKKDASIGLVITK